MYRAFPSLLAGALGCAMAGCAFSPLETPAIAAAAEDARLIAPDPAAPRLSALETRHFELAGPEQEVIGTVQVLFSRYENTFSTISREYDLGLYELRHANPDVDHWLPGEETPIYLPTQHVLPDAPREGIVLNLPSMRLFFYSEEEGGDESMALRVTTHPIGIGRQGWATPLGSATVTDKVIDPVWYPPASVRKEHAEMGDPLPGIVPPGPDNPLGRHALALSMPGYLIHGTNKPAGVGMRVSHGCVRLYPEDIEALFGRVPRGTPVHIVDQPVLAGWHGGQLYLEVHPPLEEDERDLAKEAEAVLAKALERAKADPGLLDPELVQAVVDEKRGIPFPVLREDPRRSPDQYLASARIVENTVPLPESEAAALAE